jgi:CubicO group peptidase (beta-lactamase class C family)
VDRIFASYTKSDSPGCAVGVIQDGNFVGLIGVSGRNLQDLHPAAELMDLIVRQKALNFQPGDEFLYSNTNYFLLAEVVKRAKGTLLKEMQTRGVFYNGRANNYALGLSLSTYRGLPIAIRAASTIADNNKRTDVGGSGTPEGDTA